MLLQSSGQMIRLCTENGYQYNGGPGLGLRANHLHSLLTFGVWNTLPPCGSGLFLHAAIIQGAAEITPTFWRSIKIKRNKVPGQSARCPGTTEQLKEAIRQEVAAIPPAMTCKAMDNFRVQLQECVINKGRHLSDVIFKSVQKKIASYVLFINKINFCVPCFVWFLLTFKMWELFLQHPVL